MRRRRTQALGIPFLLLAVAGSSAPVLGLTAGSASATTTTSCRIFGATASGATGTVSGNVSRCGDQAVTGGGGIFTANSTLSSATISWQSGHTSALTGTVSFFVGSTCADAASPSKRGSGTVAAIVGSITGGTFVGDTYSAFVCATPSTTGMAETYSLVGGKVVANALGERHVKSTFFVI